MSCEFKNGNICRLKEYFAATGSLYYQEYGIYCNGPIVSALCDTKAGNAKSYREAQKQNAYPQPTPKTKGRH